MQEHISGLTQTIQGLTRQLEASKAQAQQASERAVRAEQSGQLTKEAEAQVSKLLRDVKQLEEIRFGLKTELAARDGELARLRKELDRAQDFAAKLPATKEPMDSDNEELGQLVAENDSLKRRIALLQAERRPSVSAEALESKIQQQDRDLSEARRLIDQLVAESVA